jgi:hypothetical protein
LWAGSVSPLCVIAGLTNAGDKSKVGIEASDERDAAKQRLRLFVVDPVSVQRKTQAAIEPRRLPVIVRRREGDSNPRYLAVHSISSAAQSATLSPLRILAEVSQSKR